MKLQRTKISLAIFAALCIAKVATAEPAKCLFISSYHQGYAWSDGVEQGVRKELEGHCEVRQFDMNTKKQKAIDRIEYKVRAAKALIEEWQPDVVITADDNAAKYIIKPYYKDHEIPFVFCGVNWTVEEYGFPYSNVTGMIEVAPIEPLFNKALSVAGVTGKGFYIGADTRTELKNLNRFQGAATRRGIELNHRLVKTKADWLVAFAMAQQQADFIIMGSNAGIDGWDDKEIARVVQTTSTKLSLTTHNWMMPYTMIGFNKSATEQGQWAAKIAKYILGGVKPSEIPILPNRKSQVSVNQALIDASGIEVPASM